MIPMCTSRVPEPELDVVWSGTLDVERAKSAQRPPDAQPRRPAIVRGAGVRPQILRMLQRQPGKVWSVQELADAAHVEYSACGSAVQVLRRRGEVEVEIVTVSSGHQWGVRRQLQVWLRREDVSV